MNSKKKRTKKKSGISRRALIFGIALSGACGAADAPYALIIGSVFQESGYALGGADVELIPAQPDKKFKKQSARTGGRGEFSFRVPALPMDVEIRVRATAYRPASKRVKIGGDERIDVSVILDRLSKEK